MPLRHRHIVDPGRSQNVLLDEVLLVVLLLRLLIHNLIGVLILVAQLLEFFNVYVLQRFLLGQRDLLLGAELTRHDV